MKISDIALKNVRALPDLRRSLLDGSKKPHDVILVTGPMGSGKTRLLEAIATWKEATGPYGAPPSVAGLARDTGAFGEISGVWELSPDEVRRGQISSSAPCVRVEVGAGAPAPVVERGLRKVLSDFFREPTHGKVEYFPASRSLSDRPLPVPLDALSEKAEAPMRTSRDPDKYGVERAWIGARLEADLAAAGAALEGRGVLISRQAPDSLAPMKAAIAKLCPHLRLVGLGKSGSRPEPKFLRAAADTRVDRAEVGLSDLSSGEQQAVLFAAAFQRLALSRSVVLIDTPELGLHPADHARFFRALCALGEDNQIFAATSSHGILGTVAPDQIIDLSPERRA